MFLQITAQRDPHLIAAATRHELRRPVLLARIGGWALIALAVLLEGLNFPMLVAGVVLAVVVPMFLINNNARRVVRDGGPMTVEVSAEGVACSTLTSRHTYAWNAFTHARHLAGQVVLGLGGGRYVQIPTRGLSPQQIHELLTAARAHGVPMR
ncbi:YcxB family protein [Actinoplanes bogorensis]|uniref:YcxB family protein n=1 Tax=Paractinoplanes bogorensis TaxID=1610840 RepID=A0ABS5Z2Z6_9ACTN|nr:YcxB family protein [Actinoplanes bogorensis]MBU2670028.1 YcxB family protein [Actinoplanes bogorensis]